MPSLFDRRFNERVIPAAERAFGVSVTLHRGHLSTLAFTARRNDVEHAAMGAEYGNAIQVLMRDFLLPVASVVLAGDTVEPKTGDRITEGDEVFEIYPPDRNRPSVELQAGGADWLVHTKRVQ